MARFDFRKLNTPRVSGQPTNFGGVISSTVSGTGLSSITVKRMKGGVVFLSPDFLNQLKSQGATAVITSQTDTTATVTFFHVISKINALLNGVGTTSYLMPTTVTLKNASTVASSLREQEIEKRLSGT
jgi:hypothetical protein